MRTGALHCLTDGPDELGIGELLCTRSRGHKVSPLVEASFCIYDSHCLTQSPAQAIPLDSTAGAPTYGVCDPRATGIVQVHDRNGSVPGTSTGPPERLESRPVGDTPGHRRVSSLTQAESRLRPFSLRALMIALPARVDIRCLKPWFLARFLVLGW
jgi:hypothetical protein